MSAVALAPARKALRFALSSVSRGAWRGPGRWRAEPGPGRRTRRRRCPARSPSAGSARRSRGPRCRRSRDRHRSSASLGSWWKSPPVRSTSSGTIEAPSWLPAPFSIDGQPHPELGGHREAVIRAIDVDRRPEPALSAWTAKSPLSPLTIVLRTVADAVPPGSRSERRSRRRSGRRRSRSRCERRCARCPRGRCRPRRPPVLSSALSVIVAAWVTIAPAPPARATTRLTVEPGPGRDSAGPPAAPDWVRSRSVTVLPSPTARVECTGGGRDDPRRRGRVGSVDVERHKLDQRGGADVVVAGRDDHLVAGFGAVDQRSRSDRGSPASRSRG